MFSWKVSFAITHSLPLKGSSLQQNGQVAVRKALSNQLFLRPWHSSPQWCVNRLRLRYLCKQKRIKSDKTWWKYDKVTTCYNMIKLACMFPFFTRPVSTCNNNLDFALQSTSKCLRHKAKAALWVLYKFCTSAQNLRFLRFDASISGHTAPAPLHQLRDETRQEKYMALDSTWWHLKLTMLDNVKLLFSTSYWHVRWRRT